MNRLRTLIFGVGKRVIETALPAFHRANDRYEIRAIFGRSARSETIDGVSYSIRSVKDLAAADLESADLIYIAVGKSAVRDVARLLRAFDVSRHTLLIDTPVVTLKQLDVVADLERFGRAYVAEDCIALPWYDAIAALESSGVLGEVREVRFDRSAYKYHGNAMAKTLLRSDEVLRASTTKSGGAVVRTLEFAAGKRAVIVEPRDYKVGHVECIGTSGSVDDRATDRSTGDPKRPRHVLEPLLDGERCVGVRCGSVEARLDEAEAALMLSRDRTASVTARMEDWKRVGFLRLLRRMSEGRAAYSLAAGLDDMLVDWNLERFGRYQRGGFFAAGSFGVRRVLPFVTRILARG